MMGWSMFRVRVYTLDLRSIEWIHWMGRICFHFLAVAGLALDSVILWIFGLVQMLC